jgi:hypothetical protein
MQERSYIPIYGNWIELMETKDTEEKQLAFLKGIFDAFAGIEPPRPRDMENPRGVDYARRDGYLVAIPVVERPADRSELGRRGGVVCGGRKADVARENGRNGGRPKKADDNSGHENPSKTQAENPSQNPSENPSENPSQKTQALRIEKEKEEEYKKLDIARSRDRAPSPEEERFEKFWSAYPSNCPRKADKKRCREKWKTIMAHAADPEATFNAIMAGLARWKASEMWSEGDGQFIRAPLVWLNNANWEEEPKPAGQPEAEDEAAAAQRRFREEEERQKAILRAKGLMP